MQTTAAVDEDQRLAGARGKVAHARPIYVDIGLGKWRAGDRHEATPAASCALRTLPDADRGSSARTTIWRGYLNAAKRSRQCPINSATVTRLPISSTTNARTSSPSSGCG